MSKIVYNEQYGGFSLSSKASDYLKAEHPEFWNAWGCVNTVLSNTPRHSTALVEVVEVLGEAANGDSATLKIKEISSDLYRIDEYDGFEDVITPEDEEYINITNP